MHYGQEIISGRFSRYNYGKDENKVRYGTHKSPDYDLKKVNAPVALHWGDNDVLVDPVDVKKLSDILPNVILNRKVPRKGFNHVDFLIAINVTTLLYDSIIEIITKYDD